MLISIKKTQLFDLIRKTHRFSVNRDVHDERASKFEV